MRFLTASRRSVRLDAVRFFVRSFVRTMPIALALLLAGAPVAECFTPPPGAEMPCCANMHHDESCGQAGSAAQCCEHARTQAAYGVIAAKHLEASSSTLAVLSPVIAAPSLSQLPEFGPIAFDTGPPPRSTRLHIVLSVFLI
jgi:hypothetical protein